MPLRNFIPKHLHDTFAAPIEHVLQLFSGTPESDLPPTSSKTKRFSPPTEKIVTDAFSKPKSMSESRSSRTNKPLDRVLEGYFGSEIVIDDEEEELNKDNKAQRRPSLPKRSQEQANHSRNDTRRSRYWPQSSEEEDRLLGIARKTPADATRIQNPMSRFREQQRGLGLRPVNTLYGSPSANSSREEFYQQRIRGVDYLQSKTPKSQKLRDVHRTPPRKKQRTGSSPREIHKTEVINLDDSQEFDRTERFSAEKTHDHDNETGEHHAKQLSSASRRRSSLQNSNDQPSRIRRVIRKYRDDSPDDLMGHDFTKNAKQQRLQNTNDDDRQQRLNGILRSSTPLDGDEPPKKANTNEPDKRRTSNGMSTPDQSGSVVARLAVESPDELQSDSVTHDVSAQNSYLQISGSSIVENLRKSKTPAKSQKIPQKEEYLRIPIRAVVGFRLPSTRNYELVIAKREKRFYIDYKDHSLSEDPISPRIGFDKIDKIWCSETDGCNIVALCFRGNFATSIRSCYVDFATCKGLRDFLFYIEGETSIETRRRGGEWLQNAMAKVNATQDIYLTDSRSITTDGISKDEDTTERNKQPQSKRPRLDERLDHPVKNDRSAISSDSVNAQLERTSDKHTPQQFRPLRHTRSTANLIQGTERTPAVPKKTIPRREGPRWKTELVYPLTGRKRESVSWDDLARLEDDEFLNDNLVGLFLRYLQERADQDRLKKMHFFSSFFFEKLTTNTEARSNRRQINYKGVSSWTKNLNLFSRDFVIVPVNENLHWYVMIICNLSELKNPKTEEEEVEINMVDAPQEERKANFSNDGSNDVEDLTADEPTLSSKRFEAAKKGRRKSYKPAHRKYDVKKPIIITLDSLNIARSTTATALKQYIVEEAQNKLQLSIEQSEIQGMTAKGIPLQSNYSDCGLYVCMYIEQFMKDPYAFVRRILQREDAELRWPKSIESRHLRQKFYQMLQELYAAQEEKREAIVSEIGSILVTMQSEAETETEVDSLELRQLTAATVKSGAKFYHEYKAETQSSPLEEDHVVYEEAEEAFKDANKTLEVSDDESRASAQPTMPSRLSTSSKSKYFDAQDLPIDEHQENYSNETQTDDAKHHSNSHMQHSREVVEKRQQEAVHDDDEMSVDLVDKSNEEVIINNGVEDHAQWQGISDEVPETPEMVIAESINGEDDDMLMKE